METDFDSFEHRIKKLMSSQPIVSNGMEHEGCYELNNKSAEKYLREHLRGNYLNIDTGDLIRITRKGAEKVTRHDAENMAHLRSLALIPELIRQAIFIAEETNEKDKNEYDTFRYYVVGLRMQGIDYTVKMAIGVKNGFTYFFINRTKTGANLRLFGEIAVDFENFYLIFPNYPSFFLWFKLFSFFHLLFAHQV